MNHEAQPLDRDQICNNEFVVTLLPCSSSILFSCSCSSQAEEEEEGEMEKEEEKEEEDKEDGSL